MDTQDAETLLRCAGTLHFCQLPAMAYFRRHVLVLGPDLERLTPINQRIVRVVAGGLVALVIGHGGLLLVGAGALVGSPFFGAATSLFWSVFWLARFSTQAVLYTPIWPSGTATERFSHRALCVLFTAKSALFGLAALILSRATLAQWGG